jgi:sugar transferase EpsL
MLAGPVILLVALLIRATIGSPVLFRQLRPGFRGRPFLYKFRTMRLQDDSGSSTDEQRISRVGGFLRRQASMNCPNSGMS